MTKLSERSKEYIKGYNAGKAHLSSIRKHYAGRIEKLEGIIKTLTKKK